MFPFSGCGNQGGGLLSNRPKVTELTGSRVGIQMHARMALTCASALCYFREGVRDGERERGQNKGRNKEGKEKEGRKEKQKRKKKKTKRREKERKGKEKKRKEKKGKEKKIKEKKKKAPRLCTHDDCGSGDGQVSSQGSCPKKLEGQEEAVEGQPG